MIKPFHKLTRMEFDKLVEQGITWEEMAQLYPQPVWCSYPGAVEGAMGCWKLMDFQIKSRMSCTGCDCYVVVEKKQP